jgi:hypothetical protein
MPDATTASRGSTSFTFNDLEATEGWRTRMLERLTETRLPAAPPTTAPTNSSRDATAGRRTTDLGQLIVQCPDRPGIVAAVGSFLARAGANIVTLNQHATEDAGGTFFQRTEFHLPGLAAARADLERSFATELAEHFDMDFRLTEAAKPKRVAIMVSKTDHCVLDLLWRNRRGELDMSVVMVISNHPDLADEIRPFGVPYFHIPATRDTRGAAEQRQLELLRGNVDLVVLARYMQIISPEGWRCGGSTPPTCTAWPWTPATSSSRSGRKSRWPPSNGSWTRDGRAGHTPRAAAGLVARSRATQCDVVLTDRAEPRRARPVPKRCSA